LSASRAPKVFISYRREETAGHAGRLYDVVSSRFGDDNVFMDVDMAPGVDFVQRIKDAVGGCHVLLVVIGPRWSTIANGALAPRLADPGDFVRLEVEEGLRRANVTVIPVLVGGARMPGRSELPVELHPLSRRNALELSDTRWRYDVDRLVDHLDRLVRGPARPAPPAPPTAPSPASTLTPRERPAAGGGLPLAITATVVAVVAAAAGRAIANGFRWGPESKAGKVLQPVSLGALTWALWVAAAAVCVAIWMRGRGGGPAARSLWLGALVGAVSGAAAAAIANVPKWVPIDPPSKSTLAWIAALGLTIAGAIAGALLGWVWARRGSAGFSAGLLGGALVGLLQRGWHGNTDSDRVSHAIAEALLIAGVVAFTQAVLDAADKRRTPN
jgi:hypothetical protein